MLKTLLWIFIILIIVGGGVYLWWSGILASFIPSMTPAATQTETQNQQQQVAEQPQGSLPSGNDTSDQALEQDVAAFDAQMAAYGSASSQVDQSLNDKPVTQEY